MLLPNELELATYGAQGAVEVVTFGQEGDSYRVCRDRLSVEFGKLVVRRIVTNNDGTCQSWRGIVVCE
jgi:hypothetical protein